MEMIPVSSSNVEAIGHDGTNLQVKFLSGSTYIYAGVPVEVFEHLKACESVGRSLNTLVKAGGYPAARVS